MKKTLIIILSVALLAQSCVKSTDNNNTTVTVVPVSPTTLAGYAVSATKTNLSWSDNSTNENGFKVERKIAGGTYSVVATTIANITNYDDTTLTPNTTYTYRVYSFNGAGNSLTYTNEINITTPTAPPAYLSLTNQNIAGIYKITNYLVYLQGTTLGLTLYDTVFNKPCLKAATHTFYNTGVHTYQDFCSPPTARTNSYTIVQPNQLTFDGKQYSVKSLTVTDLTIAFDSTVSFMGNPNNATFVYILTRQ